MPFSVNRALSPTKSGVAITIFSLYSAFAGYRDILASLMVILTAKNPPQIQANTTKGS